MGEEAGANGPKITWDRSAAQALTSSIASSAPLGGDIVLNFGVRLGTETPGDGLAVALRRKIAMRPITARRLCDMLGRILAETGAKIRTPE